MGFLRQLSTVAPPRMRASTYNDYTKAFWGGDALPDLWLAALSGSGMAVSPELNMTLSAYYCGVTTIAYHVADAPLRCFKRRSDGGLDRVTPTHPGDTAIGGLAYRLLWQPNQVQTAFEFVASMIAQFKMRNVAYAEILAGPSGFADQLLPRHPDRVKPERLPNGRIRYKLTEPNGQPARYVTQDEMFVIRDISTDGGLSALSSVAYGANTMGTALAAERAAGRFFKTGMTAALLATYTGEMEDEDEAALHASISRYAAGVENSFGLMLVPDDVKVSNLAIEPQKAQMMEARQWTVYEVARLLRISPKYLMVRDETGTYGSFVQESIDHVVNCLRPITVLSQQSIQRDLVIEQDTYEFSHYLGDRLKGDPAQMGDFIQKMIASRAMTPSEARMAFLDMNPDDHLDQLSETDNKPGSTKTASEPSPASAPSQAAPNAALFQAWGFVRAAAERCVRRERVAVEKLAKKHATDVDGWQEGLRGFYAEHAAFVAETMRLPLPVARELAAQHGEAFAAHGVAMLDGESGSAWERQEADRLGAVAVEHGRAA